MYKKLIANLLLLAALWPAHFAAHAETIEDGRVWLNLNMIGHLPAENWRWYAELQPRWRNEGETFDQVLIRPAVLYDFNKQTSAWLGYANVITDPAGRKSFEEHRVWQQILHNFTPIGDVTLKFKAARA